MNKELVNKFLNKLGRPARLILILALLQLFTNDGWSQKKQLTPSNKVIKIAFIDHEKLRKEFKAFAAAKEKMAKENDAKKKSFENELEGLDKRTKEQLKLDSANGGRDQEKIINDAAVERSKIMSNHQSDQKKRTEERIVIMQDNERKIILAIESVVSEGGFTDVKPFIKAAPDQKGVNITDLILKKLN